MKIPAFEIIGSRDGAVAIVEVPKGRSAKDIATAIMKQHKNVKGVLQKAAPRRGKYRKRSYKIIAGGKNTEVLHLESGCRIIVDPRKTYFSGRESSERLRIAGKVKRGEEVGVFFAGAGPLAIVIAKKAKPRKVVGIEINPQAVKYFRKNIELNRLEDTAEAVKGDVKTVAKKYRRSFDRIVMPLPESASEFLKEAELCAKKNATVHYYCFCKENEVADERKKIRSSIKRKIRFMGAKKVLQWGPRIFKMRIDFRVY